ncbi:MAG: sugar phosphate isomerase/epimerase, partial [Terriglobia bacterium]
GINSPTRFYKNADYTRECFAKMGRWIMSCHAKDLHWVTELNVHFLEVIPGRGEIDYRPYLRGIADMPTEAPLMLEHLKTAEEYDEGQRYIRKIAGEISVKFV